MTILNNKAKVKNKKQGKQGATRENERGKRKRGKKKNVRKNNRAGGLPARWHMAQG